MMSRLAGGIGGRGPGETKLEISRRRAKERIHDLERRLKRSRPPRSTTRPAPPHRRARRRHRRLHQRRQVEPPQHRHRRRVIAEDKLFATLDPVVRRIRFPKDYEVVLLDTVGFIRDLPRTCAPRSPPPSRRWPTPTSAPRRRRQRRRSRSARRRPSTRILGELGLAEKPRLVVWNKADRAVRRPRASGQRASGRASRLPSGLSHSRPPTRSSSHGTWIGSASEAVASLVAVLVPADRGLGADLDHPLGAAGALAPRLAGHDLPGADQARPPRSTADLEVAERARAGRGCAVHSVTTIADAIAAALPQPRRDHPRAVAAQVDELDLDHVGRPADRQLRRTRTDRSGARADRRPPPPARARAGSGRRRPADRG
jgi:hypothetical protein